MEIEDYVSYGVAKMLEEKGFNEPCFAIYTPKTEKEYRLSRRYPAEDISEICKIKDGCRFDEYLAPSLYEAQKWLREKHHTHIHLYYNCGWNYVIWDIDEMEWVGEDFDFHSYEEALNEGINDALTYI